MSKDRLTRREFLQATAGLGAALAAGCAPDTSKPTETFTPRPTESGAPTPIEDPTKTSVPSQTSTHEVTPTVEQLTSFEARELANQLECHYGPDCISEFVKPSDEERVLVHFEVISTGLFEEIDVANSSGQKIGEAILANVVSRDRLGNPITSKVMVQGEFNSYPPMQGTAQTILLMQGYSLSEVQDQETLWSLERWKEEMPKGSQWTFNINGKGEVNLAQLQNTEFNTKDYREEISEFVSTKGLSASNNVLVVPQSMSDR